MDCLQFTTFSWQPSPIKHLITLIDLHPQLEVHNAVSLSRQHESTAHLEAEVKPESISNAASIVVISNARLLEIRLQTETCPRKVPPYHSSVKAELTHILEDGEVRPVFCSRVLVGSKACLIHGCRFSWSETTGIMFETSYLWLCEGHSTFLSSVGRRIGCLDQVFWHARSMSDAHASNQRWSMDSDWVFMWGRFLCEKGRPFCDVPGQSWLQMLYHLLPNQHLNHDSVDAASCCVVVLYTHWRLIIILQPSSNVCWSLHQFQLWDRGACVFVHINNKQKVWI